MLQNPDFNPALNPLQMLRLGVFEGKYLNATRAEYPRAWFVLAKLSPVANPALNAFGKKSRQSLHDWRANGWINDQDPLGWFQWYARYCTGRRTPDDSRQIARQRAFVRHSGQVLKHGGGDKAVRRIQRQALLQWAHDPFPDVEVLAGETVYGKTFRLLGL